MLKLIRDGYVNNIEDERICILGPETPEYREFLIEKLYEEIRELEESDFKDVMEYADVYEVFQSLLRINGITEEEVIKAKVTKHALLGGFNDGIILSY
jgi:predicted house-cleaning noncanonical NTP pyrophosphatase (MazG superfamily)